MHDVLLAAGPSSVPTTSGTRRDGQSAAEENSAACGGRRSAPTTVTDELYARLLGQLGTAAMVELTVFIGFANVAGRVNTADGITSQGYSDACEIPLAATDEGG
jgi:hypothetical protein